MITKSDLCWVLLRAAGIYLIYTGLMTAFGLFAGLFAARGVAQGLDLSDPSSTWAGLFLGTAMLPFAFGVYLLKSGRTIHACLMAVPDLAATPDAGERNRWMGMEGTELAEFYNWLRRNPEFKSLPPEDQVARFRDSCKPGH